jgi:hypothetical protein
MLEQPLQQKQIYEAEDDHDASANRDGLPLFQFRRSRLPRSPGNGALPDMFQANLQKPT